MAYRAWTVIGRHQERRRAPPVELNPPEERPRADPLHELACNQREPEGEVKAAHWVQSTTLIAQLTVT